MSQVSSFLTPNVLTVEHTDTYKLTHTHTPENTGTSEVIRSYEYVLVTQIKDSVFIIHITLR